jgi:hypothetical protein
MGDLTSRKWIVAKGFMFLFIAVSSAGLIVWQNPSWPVAILLLLLAWAAARFYYFLFYVLEKYVDPSLRYAGILALLRQIARGRK